MTLQDPICGFTLSAKQAIVPRCVHNNGFDRDAVGLFNVFGDRLELVLHCQLGECQTYSGLNTKVKGWHDGAAMPAPDSGEPSLLFVASLRNISPLIF